MPTFSTYPRRWSLSCRSRFRCFIHHPCLSKRIEHTETCRTTHKTKSKHSSFGSLLPPLCAQCRRSRAHVIGSQRQSGCYSARTSSFRKRWINPACFGWAWLFMEHLYYVYMASSCQRIQVYFRDLLFEFPTIFFTYISFIDIIKVLRWLAKFSSLWLYTVFS